MKKTLSTLLITATLWNCTTDEPVFFVNEDPATFAEIGSIDVGDVGAAEISAYDPITKKLFVVNNSTVNKIDVLDLSNPASIRSVGAILLTTYGGLVNSLAVSNGKLAAALEAADKVSAGKVVVFNTADNREEKVVTVGSLPDMLTYTPDGKFILTANEGEPNAAYTVDPVGSISIISVEENYAVTTLDFAPFAAQQSTLLLNGMRIYGPNADITKDMEPEYIAISDDSRTAWVTVQENNAIAKIDLGTKKITDVFPLGFKNYNLVGNEIDPSDRDNAIRLRQTPLFGMYQPDGIAFMRDESGNQYLFTANEGDAREYTGFTEMRRASAVTFDATAFPTASILRQDAQLGRMNVTTTLGDTDGDRDYDALYSLGARSFSIWNGWDGRLIYDSKTDLEQRAIAAGIYDDARSDDKGVEPEGIAIGTVGNRKVLFVGLERADAVVTYDVTNPRNPVYLQTIKCGDAPEGVMFIAAKDSPTGQSLLVVSSENDGIVKVYRPNKL
jgi:hypothetical protein